METKCKCPSPYGGLHCETNLCSGVNCGTHGNCYYGNCECETGYEGGQCDSLVTDKFLGIFHLTANCNGNLNNYNSTIIANGPPSSREIKIAPVLGELLYAKVSGRNITIGGQEVPNGTTYSGSGSINDDGTQIHLDITIDPFGSPAPYTCAFTLAR